MIVLAFTPGEAARIVAGEQTVVTYGSLAIPPSTERWRRPSDLVGQTVAIARLPEPCHVCDSGPLDVNTATHTHTQGAIVGSARVADVGSTSPMRGAGAFVLRPDGSALAYISKTQRRFADFTPGRWAVIFTDAKPCEERCPTCTWARTGPETPVAGCTWLAHLDTTPACPTCDRAGTCAPIPCEVTGPIMEWTP